MCTTKHARPLLYQTVSGLDGVGGLAGKKVDTEARFRTKGKAVSRSLQGCRIETKTADVHHQRDEHGSHHLNF